MGRKPNFEFSFALFIYQHDSSFSVGGLPQLCCFCKAGHHGPQRLWLRNLAHFEFCLALFIHQHGSSFSVGVVAIAAPGPLLRLQY